MATENRAKIANALYWQSVMRQSFVAELTSWSASVRQRLLPAFSNIEREAAEVEAAAYVRRVSVPAGEDDHADLADIAVSARDDGIEHFARLQGVRQGLINLATAGVYHLFEQQVGVFVRRELIAPLEERDAKFVAKLHTGGAMFDEFKRRLLSAGIDYSAFESVAVIEELRLVANTVKHGGGASAEELRERAPLLFVPPMLRGDDQPLPRFARSTAAGRKRPPRRPLAGHDVYVSESDFNAYCEATMGIWRQLAVRLTE